MKVTDNLYIFGQSVLTFFVCPFASLLRIVRRSFSPRNMKTRLQVQFLNGLMGQIIF